ncbi:MAG: flagellar motor switch protein FliM [Deltaproteobacteria bacterium]|nr:flagellar motor switch protein FliM [Deltaproteobacteria bacterium]
MSQILSQDEVDALLKGISGGEIETEPEAIDESISHPYDLTSQDKIVRDRMPTLEMLTEQFARMFRTTMSSLLRKVVSVNIVSLKMMKYGEFMRTVPLPTSMHVFKMDPLKGNSLFVFESKIIFTLVDILFGGTGRDSFKVEGRDFTAIENGLIRKVVLSALNDLEKVWKPLINLNIVYQRSEVNPQFVQIVLPSEVVIVTVFEIEMDFSSGNITLCIPYSTIEPIKEKMRSGYQVDNLEVSDEWKESLESEVRLSSVNMEVLLGKTELKGREIANLKKGDVILLDRYYSDDLDVYVEGFLKFKGQPGVYKGNQALQISQVIMED